MLRSGEKVVEIDTFIDQYTSRILPTGRYVYAEIIDNGCGIPPENLNRIFDPFFTTKDIGRGTGLGLSIAHELATSHGGRLTANNDADGVSFHLRLPCQQG